MDKKTQQMIGMGAAGALAISTFLPWVSFMGMSASLFSGSAWRAILIILCAVLGGLMIWKEVKLAIAPLGIAAFFVVSILFDGIPFSVLGFGFWVAL
ncbi:MAG: hypothetical protein AAF570_17005, partial [Bacteroidota bacterium]